MNIALFDFCETLVNFQTADEYVFFVVQNTQNADVQRKYQFYKLLRKTKLIKIMDLFWLKGSLNKRWILSLCKGLPETEMESLAKKYYENRLKPAFIKETIEELKHLKSLDYKIYIVSGGYDIYLKYFADDFGVDEVISTEIKFENGMCQGKFANEDCLKKQKICYLNAKEIRKEADYVVAYSDSITDMPMLKWADKGVVVSKDKSRAWAKKAAMEELIWEN